MTPAQPKPEFPRPSGRGNGPLSPLTRRAFLPLLSACAPSPGAEATGSARMSPGPGAEATGSARPRPNLVFILADDLGWGDLSCYGNRRCQTPNLDKLATQGVLFTQFYVNASVCSPSRTAFTTGQYPARHRVHGHFATTELNARRGMPDCLDPNVPTLAASLKRAGYSTAHFGKWHLGNNPGSPMPGAYGFDTHASVNSNETRWTAEAEGFRARSTAWIVDNALDFIAKQKSQPFYTQLWTLLPHAPLAPTGEQMEPFSKLQPGPHVPHKGAWQIYNASLKNLDDELGRFFRRLEDLGQADNTLVLFSSDNGPEDIHVQNAAHSGVGSPGPFRGRKRSLYEGGVRLPLIARWPGRIPAGRVDNRSVVSAIDFAPTLTRLANAEPLPKPDGEDIGDILTGASRPRRTDLYWDWRFNIAGYYQNRSPRLSLRSGDRKLLMNPDRSRIELYDIPKDPGEAQNLAAANPAAVEALSAKLLAWHKTLPEGPTDPGAGTLDYPWPKSASSPQASSPGAEATGYASPPSPIASSPGASATGYASRPAPVGDTMATFPQGAPR